MASAISNESSSSNYMIKCGSPKCDKVSATFKKCQVCLSVSYCSKECQTNDWKLRHKLQCQKLKEELIIHQNHELDSKENALALERKEAGFRLFEMMNQGMSRDLVMEAIGQELERLKGKEKTELKKPQRKLKKLGVKNTDALSTKDLIKQFEKIKETDKNAESNKQT